MSAARHSRARHKRDDIRAVAAAFEHDPRWQQERIRTELRRRMIVGDNADPVLSSCPFDVMLARRVRAGNLVFTDDHHQAGMWFLRLYRYRNGGCKLKGCLDVSQGPVESERPHMDVQYRALAADRRMSGGVLDMLADVIVFGMWPGWLSDIVAGKSGEGQAEFMAALDDLREIWIECGSWSSKVA